MRSRLKTRAAPESAISATQISTEMFLGATLGALLDHRVALIVRDSCSQLGRGECTPETVAKTALGALETAPAAAGEAVTSDNTPAQGEFEFDKDVDYTQRYAIVEPAASAGDACAQQTLALLTYAGVGGATESLRESACWHAKAAAQGHLDALATLGGCVRSGRGAERDETAGIAIIRAMAAAGAPVGLTKLGVLHDEGLLPGEPADTRRAAELFARAAEERDNAVALFNHGWGLVHGEGDVDGGFEAWRAAASLAPNDGAEEAAYHLWLEQDRLSAARRKELRPDRYLRLAAELEFPPALAAMRGTKQ